MMNDSFHNDGDESDAVSLDTVDDESQPSKAFEAAGGKAKKNNDESSTPVGIRKTDMYAIICSKVTVYIVLLLAAASVGTVTWILTSGDEVSSFESEVRTTRCETAEAHHSFLRSCRPVLSVCSRDHLCIGKQGG